jgi:hypothetical protein
MVPEIHGPERSGVVKLHCGKYGKDFGSTVGDHS